MLQKLGTGWRRTALINTSIVFILTLFGIILFVCTVSKSGGLGINYIIFQGTCKKSRSINTWLHLFLNACSTGILASSNFFMQVLTSPTRSEVDKAHSKNISLKIGVQSMRNLYRAPRVKLVSWVLFFITSFPLHLFFNSAIFQTEYMSSDWNLTIASEGFIYGAEYYPPGVIVLPPVDGPNRSVLGATGYGQNPSFSKFFDPKSDVSNRIKFAADHAHDWKRLEASDCLHQYQRCSERIDLGDLVMIVKSNNLSFMASDDYTQGWKQSAIFNLTGISDGPKDGWHQKAPENATNSLWYTASCRSQLLSGMYQNRSCSQTCIKALFFRKLERFIISSQTRPKPPAPSTYTNSFLNGMATTSPTLIGEAMNVDLEYCLAQKFPRCKVCVSNGLLLIVVISIALKAGLCFMVLHYLSKEDPLVVPGDAITSFIRSPDKFTAGRCLLDRELESVLGERSYPFVGAPIYWHPERRRWSRSIDGIVWARNYVLLITNFMFLFAMFFLSHSSNPLGNQSFSQSVENGVLDVSGATANEFIPAVLKVNLPQLLLSLFYFNYNSLFTRLCAEKEWSSYGTDYLPLRVTEPQGRQRSTFRLQLPYRYSVPLILASIFLHWLVSRALYVFVFEGGYFDPPTVDHNPALQTGLSDDALIGIGWSAPALLALLVTVSIMAILPLILTRPTIKSPMPLAVSSSLVLSAACHVPILEDIITDASERPAPDSESGFKSALGRIEGCSSDQEAAQRFSGSTLSEMEHLLALPDAPLQIQKRGSTDIESQAQKPSDLDIERYLMNVSQSQLRWGEAKAQVLGGKQRVNVKNIIGHLSFGTRQHDVGEPIRGRLYT